ncbi:hypothetical protein ES703_63551 [subsurface metagenome]
MNVVHYFPAIEDLLGLDHRFEFRKVIRVGHALKDQQFLVIGRVVHQEFEHEAVYLGFRQRIGALLLDRILGSHHHKGLGQWEGVGADGHLIFLHGLQQGALHLGGRAVDLVGEHDIGENGTLLDFESPLLGIVDQGADQVRGQQVRRELDALEPGLNEI